MRQCGIYYITHIESGKTYFGQSSDIRTRIRKHNSQLRRNRHHCRFLQNAWNKYGQDSFKFGILLKCDPDMLFQFEEWAFGLVKDEFRYNTASPGRAPTRGRRLSDETREKIRSANTGKKLSDDTKGKISLAAIGRRASVETKKKLSAARTGKQRTDVTKAKMSVSNRKISSGATLDRKTGKWKAQIAILGKKIYLGSFATKEEAEYRYKLEVEKLC